MLLPTARGTGVLRTTGGRTGVSGPTRRGTGRRARVRCRPFLRALWPVLLLLLCQRKGRQKQAERGSHHKDAVHLNRFSISLRGTISGFCRGSRNGVSTQGGSEARIVLISRD